MRLTSTYPVVEAEDVTIRGSDVVWTVTGDYTPGEKGDPMRFGKSGVIDWGTPGCDPSFDITGLTVGVVIFSSKEHDVVTVQPIDPEQLPETVLSLLRSEVLAAIEEAQCEE